MTIDTPVGSDTIIAAPLTKTPVFQGAVASVTDFTLTFDPSPGFSSLTTAPHYVQAANGNQAGIIFDVASNTSNSITLVDNGIAPTGLTNGISVKVVPYWTLGELFPAEDVNVSFTPSVNAINRRTQILFPNMTGVGINRAPSSTFFYLNDGNGSYWRAIGAGTTNFNATPVLPDSYFTVRNPANSATNLQVTIAGSVNVGTAVVELFSTNGIANDNYVSLGRPTDIVLDDLELIDSGAFTPSPNTINRQDQLLIISNSNIAINKGASVTYFYVTNSNPANQGWRAIGFGNTNVGTNVIPAATGYIIRKSSNNPTGTTFWSNNITIAP